MKWLETAGTFFLAVYAPVGVALLGVKSLVTWQLKDVRAWLILWAVLLLPVATQLSTGQAWMGLLIQSLFYCVLGFLLHARKRHVATGFTLALFFLVVAGGLERQLSKQLWVDVDTPPSLQNLQGVSLLNNRATEPNGYRTVAKSWTLPADTRELTLSFEARLLGGQPGWDWFRYNPNFRLTPSTEAGEVVTRVVPPSADEASRHIAKEVTTTVPLAGRTFRTRVDLRSEAGVTTSGCDGLQLEEAGGQFAEACLPLTLTPDWQTFELTWAAPPEALSKRVRIVLRNIDAVYEVRGGVIEERIGDSWVSLGSLEPSGVSIYPVLPNTTYRELPTFTFIPEVSWQAYSFSLDDPALETLEKLNMTLQLEGGIDIALRGVSLQTVNGSAQPLANPRSRLWFPQANLAGHTVGTVGLVALSTFPSSGVALGTSALTLLGVFLTGSRAAWLAVLLGLPWLLYLRWRSKRYLGIALAFCLLLALSLVVLDSSNRLRIIGVDDTVSRHTIWRVAAGAFLDEPLTGLGEGNFEPYWRDNVNYRFVPTHAHNAWLAYASSYGLPGLVAILWFTGGLVFIAWRWGRWRGLALVTPILIMNVFDYTLFYSGVLLPLVLGLNLLRATNRTEPAD